MREDCFKSLTDLRQDSNTGCWPKIPGNQPPSSFAFTPHLHTYRWISAHNCVQLWEISKDSFWCRKREFLISPELNPQTLKGQRKRFASLPLIQAASSLWWSHLWGQKFEVNYFRKGHRVMTPTSQLESQPWPIPGENSAYSKPALGPI